MIQVTYFKKTGGKRIFRMAPIHHHFELWRLVRDQSCCGIFSISNGDSLLDRLSGNVGGKGHGIIRQKSVLVAGCRNQWNRSGKDASVPAKACKCDSV